MHCPSVKDYKIFDKKRQQTVLFLFEAVIPIFDTTNLALQKDEPLIHRLRSLLIQQLEDLLTRFIKPEIILQNKEHITCKSCILVASEI